MTLARRRLFYISFSRIRPAPGCGSEVLLLDERAPVAAHAYGEDAVAVLLAAIDVLGKTQAKLGERQIHLRMVDNWRKEIRSR
jgi:hypothetical protein